MNLYVIDLIYFAFILIFAIVGLFKGFISEVLSKAAWILGTIFALVFADDLNLYFSTFIPYPILSIVVSFLVIFIVTFIIIQILNLILSNVFKGQILGGLNRALGFFLGAIEGIIFVMTIIFIFTIFPKLHYKAHVNGFFYETISPLYKNIEIKVPEVKGLDELNKILPKAESSSAEKKEVTEGTDTAEKEDDLFLEKTLDSEMEVNDDKNHIDPEEIKRNIKKNVYSIIGGGI